jgi:hypothetical protein
MIYRVAAALLLLVSLLPAVGCDKATPVAPNGSILTISANPSKIGPTGSSTITVVGRKPDGQPLNPGTEIRLSVDKGTIDPAIVAVDSHGEGTAIFRADGRSGTAKVTAMVGGGMTMVSTDVEIGLVAKTIVLQPTPTSVTINGGTINLLAIVRDETGQPLANQGVNFTTDVGRLNSRGAILQTNANGQVRDTLTVSATDLEGNVSTINVTAQTTSGEGALVSASAQIRVQGGRPVASFDYEGGSTANEVFFTNTSTGGVGTLDFTWDFGDSQSSTDANPSHTYSSPGPYTVRLTVVDQQGQSDVATARITVPVTTPGSGT